MRHVAPRRGLRRGRVAAAVLSASTVVAAVLGAGGVLPLDAGSPSVAASTSMTSPHAGNATGASRFAGVRVPEAARASVDRPARVLLQQRRSSPQADSTEQPGPTSGDSDGGAAKAEGSGGGAAKAEGPSGSVAPLHPSAKAVAPEPEPKTARGQPVPAGSGHGKRVVFSLSDQHVWLVKANGVAKRDYPVSGSKFDQVHPRKYHVIRTRRHTISYHGTERMNYMVTFMFGENAAIGFHDIPVKRSTGKKIQTLDQLGTRLSDGCVRQKHSDAAALWDFAPPGTPVVVVA